MKSTANNDSRKKTRVPDEPTAICDGSLVNTKLLIRDHLRGFRPETVTRLIGRGMPHIRMGSRLWFDPVAVREWWKQQQTQQNQPKRAGTNAKSGRAKS